MPETSQQQRVQDGALVGAARQVESYAARAKEFGADKFEEFADGSREMIRENPMKAVLVAAGVGALVGFMLARRR